jgi:RNA recognition motif. (a.k.a. RRM, RBD, or RNP domain)
MRLYVGNLSYRITGQELGDFFAQIGRVQRVRVVTERETGRSKGFGFVDMLNEQDARAAIEQLNGKRLGGRALTQALEVHSFWNTQADLQACIATYDLYQPETQKDLLLEAPYVVLYELLESELDLFG